MNYLVYIFSAFNLYEGVRFLLNAIGVLQTSKYAQSSNIFFGITLTTSGILALYFTILKGNSSLALIIAASPWIITILLLFVNMIFGDYK